VTLSLNAEQSAALDAIKVFLLDDAQDAFILRGSAGTGKTTLIAHLIEAMAVMRLSVELLAPTGRAARILASKVTQIVGDAGHGRTIHSAIYALTHIEVHEEAESANDPGIRFSFPLKDGDEPSPFLFVVDEASMVGDRATQGDLMQFGSGRLLKDLVTYSRLRRPGRGRDNRTKLLFVGDSAQLPPVGENASPALSEEYLRATFQLRVGSAELKTVVRQAQGSAILDRATEIRDAVDAGRFNTFSLRPDGQEIERVDGRRAIDLIARGIQARESTIAVVHANATAREYNRAVRERIWGDPDLPVQAHDTLLVNKNSRTHALSNGDLVKVVRIAPEAERATVPLKGGHVVHLSFRAAVVAVRAGDGAVIQIPCFLLENLLDSPNRELSPLELRGLLVHFRGRHPGLHPKSAEFRSAIRDDPYFNALQVKYGYAVTCHKAQGGEWHTVIVDFEPGATGRHAAFFRWAYTAITRAARKLIVVNPPEFTAFSGLWRDGPAAPSSPDPETRQGDAADPDWDIFSFSSTTAPLFPVHLQLREAWRSRGIAIEQLQHLQYCERYTLVRDGLRAVVQYHYNGKNRVGRSGTAPGALVDGQLAEDALAAFLALGGEQDAGQPEPFVQELLARVDAAVSGSPIRRTGYRAMPYRVRVSFADVGRRGEIDFTYDGKFSWTAAQEVGGPRSSHGLYEEVQALMTASAG
jgi:hypothetical protein